MSIVLAYFSCAVLWGTTWFAIRVCILGGYPPLPAAALRFTVAALLLLSLAGFGHARPGPRFLHQWGWLCVAGLLNAVGYGLVYVAEEELSGGLAAVLFSTEPLMIALLVALTGTERVSRTELLAALVALCGVAIIFWDRMTISFDQASSVVLVVIAVAVSGLYSLLVRQHAAGTHPLAATAIFLTVTCVAQWLYILVTGWEPLPWPPPLRPTVALVYLGVLGSVVTFAIYFYLFSRIGLFASSTLAFVLPVIALAVDALWERQVRLVATSYVGVAVTLLGVLLGLRQTWRRGISQQPS